MFASYTVVNNLKLTVLSSDESRILTYIPRLDYHIFFHEFHSLYCFWVLAHAFYLHLFSTKNDSV